MDMLVWALVGSVVVLTLWLGAVARLLTITICRLDIADQRLDIASERIGIADRRIDILVARVGLLAGDQGKEG